MDSTTLLGQEEIVALTGNPYFSCIISQSHIKSPYQMMLPRKFHHLLPSAVVPAILNCRGKSWEMLYYGDRSFNRFDISWKKFATGNNLEVGDALVFELMDSKKLEFRVQILKGRIPTAVGDPDGCSSATPIVID
ncbi:B3 domain-containing protein Os04g0386900-like [Magnolia sinica]|uniref:B3 domain-containing protein Os04g0386900-like n=1 Tax=Magnolia sinica TaxID=86752 RepID=UPI00265B33D1|nr:B3 domain-containing protein Os04g0386900-like [Magnolia sinica]XP_058104017.1 B3 domain-containing protein Os04g0386900-like [Magnolia sinica]XP_058104018.1 B3 domain-containing protein Os04g0386900-like [Magnolia sinica]